MNAKLKVCHLTSVHNRSDKRIGKMCNSLAVAGYEVTLLCADNEPEAVKGDFKIISVKYHPKNRIDRILNSKKIMLQAAMKIDADIYHFHDPELIPLGIKLKKIGKSVIYDSHEEYSLKILHKRWIPRLLRPFVARLFQFHENYAVKKFDAVVSVTPQIVSKFQKINLKATLVTNFPSIDSLILGNSDFICESDTAKYICFAGAIEPGRMHHNIIKALGRVPEVGYLLAGYADKKYIRQLKKLDMWKNVKYLGELSFKDVLLIYQQSIAGILIENYDDQNYGKEGSLGVTKLFEYMSFGLPVICTDFILYKEIIESYHCGICVNPNDIESIANAISYIIYYPEEAKQMGKNGILAVKEKYNWSTQEKSLLALYEEICQTRVQCC